MIYLVEFSRGFAAFSSSHEMAQVINQEAGIQISICESYEHAYVAACKNYAWKEWERNPWVLPYLPRFGDWQSDNFNFNVGFRLMQPSCWRVFSARSGGNVAILTTTENVILFIEQQPYAVVLEEPSVQSAQDHLNWVLLQHLLPFAPYLSNGLPALQNLPLDTIIPGNFAEKFKECLSTVPEQLPCPSPQWQLPEAKGGIPHVE